jgi:glucan 1,3-beta-glucosidase
MHVIILAWLGSAAVAVAQHVHYQIPQVESLVESMTKAFDAWPKYHPTRSYSHHPPTSSPTVGGCAPHWLENIKHQGISAFNSDSSYKVFRNVKDYGAKGKLCVLAEELNR